MTSWYIEVQPRRSVLSRFPVPLFGGRCCCTACFSVKESVEEKGQSNSLQDKQRKKSIAALSSFQRHGHMFC